MAHERTWMKRCCEHCPLRRGTPLVLHPERAEGFAYMAQNPYTDFPCHKTADKVENYDGGSSYVYGKHSFTCHGFKGLQLSECGGADEQHFVGDGEYFSDPYEMAEYHDEAFSAQRQGRKP